MEVATCGIHGCVPVINGNCGFCEVSEITSQRNGLRDAVNYLIDKQLPATHLTDGEHCHFINLLNKAEQ